MGRERDSRGRIPAEGLEHHGARLDAHLPQLLSDQEAMRLVADDHRGGRRQPLEAQSGLLQHGPLAGQGEQLLRVQLARQRPEACAGTARENDWGEHAANSGKARAQADASRVPRPMA